MSQTTSLDVQFRADASQFYAGIAKVNEQLTRVSRSTAETSKAVQGMAGSMRLASAGIAAFVGSQVISGLNSLKNGFVDMVEGPRDLQASFAALLADGDRAADMLQRTFSIAQRTGTSFEDAADITRRLAVGMRELGGSNAQIDALADGLLKMGRISGASMGDITGTVTQFAQALASGKAQGDELRSIMERFPALAQMIAQSMGVSTGQLKEMGSQGKITADILANAVLGNVEKINAQYSRMPMTIGAAMNNVRTAIVQAFNTEALQTGISNIAIAINNFAQYIERAANNIKSFISDVRDLYNSSTTLQTALDALAIGAAALTAAFVAMSATPIGIFLGAIGAAAFAIITNWESVKILFTHELPAWIARAQSEFFRLSAAAVASVAGMTQQISTLLGGAMDGLASRMNEASTNLAIRGADAFGEWVDGSQRAEQAYAALREQVERPTTSAGTIDPINNIGTAAQGARGHVKAMRDELEQMRADALEKINSFMHSMLSPAEQAAEKARELRAALIGVQDSIDPARVEQIRNAINNLADGTAEAWRSISSSMESSMSDAFVSMVNGTKSAERAFANMAKSILEQILKMIIQMMILKPLMGSLGGFLGFAKGGAFDSGGHLMPFATGGIVSGPTPFSFGGGRRGIMGEAGPEAIVPLRRHGGSLGVSASPVNVNVNNSADASVSVEQRDNSDGSRTIDIMIEKKVREAFGSGSMDRTMQAAYGLKRRGS